MEELLNKLIEKGWRPRGKKVELYGTGKDTFGEKIVIFNGNAGGFKRWGCTYRELVSKESGLWQFCCDKCLVKPEVDIISICSYVHYTDDHEDFGYVETEPEFWIISSSLCNEEDLEKFLLENIKIS